MIQIDLDNRLYDNGDQTAHNLAVAGKLIGGTAKVVCSLGLTALGTIFSAGSAGLFIGGALIGDDTTAPLAASACAVAAGASFVGAVAVADSAVKDITAGINGIFNSTGKSDGDGKKNSDKNYKHYTNPNQIEKEFGLKKGSFHNIKQNILKDIDPKIIKQVGNNPDIAISKDGSIQLISRQFEGKSFITDLNINWYK